MLKPNSKLVFNYVKENDGKDITAADIVDGTGLEIKSVNGIVTSAFQRHTKIVDGEKVPDPLMERVPGEIPLEDGSHKSVKFIRLTAAGKAFDPDAEDEKAE